MTRKTTPSASTNRRPRLAIYWAAACGGCDIAIVELREKLVELAAEAEIVFWPAAMDFKYADVEGMPDLHIDICLFNGAIRTTENQHMAHLLRAKSRVLVAFGSCAHEGGIPGLANLFKRESILRQTYLEAPSVHNPDATLPRTVSFLPEGRLDLPGVDPLLRTLGQVEDVDYWVPGCPPQPTQVWVAMQALLADRLPPKGAVLGATEKTVCEECQHRRHEKRIGRFYRVHEIVPDPTRCLFDQGILCAGPATRGGCGALCIKANMPCRGCYGPPPGVADQGAALLSAVASVVEAENREHARDIIAQIVDPAGTLYRFGLASSVLGRTELE
jgi:F420-non-reducing hydrogenase small subunit